MANKKFLLGILLMVFAMLAAGCTTTIMTTPVFYSHATGQEFRVLGEVRIEGGGLGWKIF